ncbi:class I SAM-dependent methyltransferase [Streptomyces sp. NPDC001165]|uniref:class I SAM-dependent methyltransferase n=1 Tax=Streptomyces sp. NPDC001165 TaxID=3364546 RepID=UPI0036929A06
MEEELPNPEFFVHRLATGPVAEERDEVLLRLCAGRRVLHVGCTDHPLTGERLRDGSILHAKLMKTGNEVLGVDVDREGIELLRTHLGGHYLVQDLSDSQGVLAAAEFKPDVILAGDVIEHVRDAASFLRGISALMREVGDGVELILSTPNGLGAKTLLNTLTGVERIHPDHVYVFTPASLARLVSDCGLAPHRWFFYHVNSRNGVRARVQRTICHVAARLRPAFAAGQVLVCRATA